MGIFFKLFGKLFSNSPNRKYWAKISLDISKGLEHVRITWFNSCVKILQESSSLKGTIKVVNTHLGGEADLAIKAY